MGKRGKVETSSTERGQSCYLFAKNPDQYRSLISFVTVQREEASEYEWKPSKSQMGRDMRTLFGADWSEQRGSSGHGCGSGGRGYGGGEIRAQNTSGLTMPKNAEYLLKTCRTTITLSALIERKTVAIVKNVIRDEH